MSGLAVTVNGDRRSVPAGSTVADLVVLVTGSAAPKGIAVAVDRCVVPRAEWPHTPVVAGCSVEVVTAAAGG